MFNIADFAGDVFTRGAKAVLKEARDAINWAKKIATNIAKLAIKLAAKPLSMLNKLIASLQKIASSLEKMIKDIGKGKMPAMTVLKKLVETAADQMGKMVSLADRLAAWVETKFVATFTAARTALSVAAKAVSVTAKKLSRGIKALISAAKSALDNPVVQDIRKEIKAALDALGILEKTTAILQKAKDGAAKAVAVVDPEKIVGKVAKFSQSTLDAVIDNAKFFAQAARIGQSIDVLRKTCDSVLRLLRKTAEKAQQVVLKALSVTFQRLLTELEELYARVMGAGAEAMKLRVKVATEAKLLETRIGKARSETDVYARTLKRLVW